MIVNFCPDYPLLPPTGHPCFANLAILWMFHLFILRTVMNRRVCSLEVNERQFLVGNWCRAVSYEHHPLPQTFMLNLRIDSYLSYWWFRIILCMSAYVTDSRFKRLSSMKNQIFWYGFLPSIFFVSLYRQRYQNEISTVIPSSHSCNILLLFKF